VTEVEVQPLPYQLLDDEDRERVEELFVSMAKHVGGIRIKCAVDPGGGTRFTVSNLPNRGEDFEGELLALGLDFSVVAQAEGGTEGPGGRSKEKRFYLADVPSYLETGFLSTAFDRGISVIMDLERVDDLRWVERRRSLTSAIKGMASEASDADYVISRAEAEGAFKLEVRFLGEGVRAWATTRRLKVSRIRQPPLLVPGSTLKLFFPFSSYEVNERGGIKLGQNALTGSPVVYDFFSRRNFNVTVLGPSGSGKSAFMKLLLLRLFRGGRVTPSPRLIIIDPQAEYGSVAKAVGASEVDLGQSAFDPVSVLTAEELSDLLAGELELTGRERVLLEAKASRAQSMASLLELLRDDTDADARGIAQALRSLMEGPLGQAISPRQGDGLSLPERSVVQIPQGKESKALIRVALAAAWDQIKRAPAGEPKVLVVDEGWMLLGGKRHSTIEEIARLGRKLNLLLLVASQRPSDFLSDEAGRAVLENSATKVIMKQDEEAVAELAKSLRLGKREIDFLTHIQSPRASGFSQALLVDEWRRIPIKVKPTDEEASLI